MRLGLPGARFRPKGAGDGEGGGRDGGRRPALWCHVGPGVDQEALCQVIDRLPDTRLVLTGARGVALPSGSRVAAEFAGRAPDMRASLDRFLTEHRIGAALFAGRDYPRLGAELCRERKVPVFLADAVPEQREGLGAAFTELGLRPRRSYRHFDRLFPARAGATADLVRLGADPGAVEDLGPLVALSEPLPCNERDREALAQQIATRPVWCALRANVGEIARIEAAHRTARRLSHRLLLILVPEDPAAGPSIAETLGRHGWTVGLRSAGVEPESDSQIYVADSEGEEGLWLRLSPITFVGGSLSDTGAGVDPIAAALLGSAVISGPAAGRYRPAMDRLRNGGACRTVASGEDLGDAVTELLAPERAAVMAARGWDITSEGAELIGRLAGLAAAALGQEGP